MYTNTTPASSVVSMRTSVRKGLCWLRACGRGLRPPLLPALPSSSCQPAFPHRCTKWNSVSVTQVGKKAPGRTVSLVVVGPLRCCPCLFPSSCNRLRSLDHRNPDVHVEGFSHPQDQRTKTQPGWHSPETPSMSIGRAGPLVDRRSPRLRGWIRGSVEAVTR